MKVEMYSQPAGRSFMIVNGINQTSLQYSNSTVTVSTTGSIMKVNFTNQLVATITLYSNYMSITFVLPTVNQTSTPVVPLSGGLCGLAGNNWTLGNGTAIDAPVYVTEWNYFAESCKISRSNVCFFILTIYRGCAKQQICIHLL